LVVTGLIVLFAGITGLALGGGASPVALHAAQSTLSSLLSAARAQAALTGRDAALLVNNNPGNTDLPNRYLRYCVVAVRNPTAPRWDPVGDGVYLAPGVYVLPATTPGGALCKANLDWTRPSGGTLRSTAFSTSTVTQAVNSPVSESWAGVGFTPHGTIGAQGLGGTGDIVLATADPQPPAANPPLQFNNPDHLCGVSLSNYGIATLIDDRSGF
jgi:hypothetical protein